MAADAQDALWDWDVELLEAIGRQDMQLVALVEGSRLHALMLLRYGAESRLNPGGRLVYVELLAVAPWNRPPQRELGGCGSVLVEHAVRESIISGWDGRLGLHSLDSGDTLDFYERTLAMTKMNRDPEVDDLFYFEYDPDAAQHFLDQQTERQGRP